MFVLFTDFGLSGPYVGQLEHVLYREAPGIPIVNLFADAPRCNPRAAAYLLAAYAYDFAPGSIFLAVVDPGVGTARRPLMLEADGRWFVGPDNGLFSVLARRARSVRCWEIDWRPPHLSNTFHGRDLFAPMAAKLAHGELPTATPAQWMDTDWPDDLAEVIYIDHFGNALTGLRGTSLGADDVLSCAGQSLRAATTFGAVPPGAAFWYINANGLVEVAVNQGEAARLLRLEVGSKLTWLPHNLATGED